MRLNTFKVVIVVRNAENRDQNNIVFYQFCRSVNQIFMANKDIGHLVF